MEHGQELSDISLQPLFKTILSVKYKLIFKKYIKISIQPGLVSGNKK